MKCDKCKKAEATVHISRTINGQSETRHLCQACADKHPELTGLGFGLGLAEDGAGGFFQGNWPSSFFNTGLSSLFGENTLNGQSGYGLTCPDCGRDWSAVRQTGMLGCPTCYESFRGSLDEIFNRLQRGNRHLGRQPGSTLKTAEEGSYNLVDTSAESRPLTELKQEDEGPAAEKRKQSEAGASSAAALRQAISKAVEAEDYLEAARLRDELKALSASPAKTDGEDDCKPEGGKS